MNLLITGVAFFLDHWVAYFYLFLSALEIYDLRQSFVAQVVTHGLTFGILVECYLMHNLFTILCFLLATLASRKKAANYLHGCGVLYYLLQDYEVLKILIIANVLGPHIEYWVHRKWAEFGMDHHDGEHYALWIWLWMLFCYLQGWYLALLMLVRYWVLHTLIHMGVFGDNHFHLIHHRTGFKIYAITHDWVEYF